MNYKKMLVFLGVLLVVAAALIGCGPTQSDDAGPQSESSVPVLKTSYYLDDGQYGIAFFDDPATNKRCVVTFNNGSGSSVSGAAAVPFCYDR